MRNRAPDFSRYSVNVKKFLSTPGQALGFQDVEAIRFHDNRRMKVVGLSALHTGHL